MEKFNNFNDDKFYNNLQLYENQIVILIELKMKIPTLNDPTKTVQSIDWNNDHPNVKDGNGLK